MLQRDEPRDYVVATGETHSVREFCELAFSEVGSRLARSRRTDPSLLRPAEVELLVGDASAARRDLGWRPTVGFAELVRIMVSADMALVGRELERIRPGRPAHGKRQAAVIGATRAADRRLLSGPDRSIRFRGAPIASPGAPRDRRQTGSNRALPRLCADGHALVERDSSPHRRRASVHSHGSAIVPTAAAVTFTRRRVCLQRMASSAVAGIRVPRWSPCRPAARTDPRRPPGVLAFLALSPAGGPRDSHCHGQSAPIR